MKFSKRTGLVVLGLSGGMGVTHAANILNNPGFETGTGTDADAWAEVSGGTTGSVIRSTVLANSGSASAYMTIDHVNNAPAPGSFFVEQNLPVGSVDPALNYNFSFFGRADSLDFTGVNLFYQLLWLDQDNSDGGGVRGEILTSVVSSITTSFSAFELTNIDVPDGTDSVLVRFQLSGGPVPDIQQGFAVDDVRLEAIPEPGSLGLLCLGGSMLVRRRRG